MGAAIDSIGKPSASQAPRIVGRYALHGPISVGGMATVHFGRLLGPVGFARTVAIKRMHPHLAADPKFAAMFIDEARLASRIHHPNVVATLDVVEADGELFLVMDYVSGLSLGSLLRQAATLGASMPPEHAVGIIVGALHGLHAAHEARNAAGELLSIVHRDVSPPNILVGEDGVARVIDFGIAKAVERVHATRDHELRGKLVYMAPEQLTHGPVDRRTDIYAASVILWELLTGRRYVDLEGASAAAKITAVLERRPEPPSSIARSVPRALDDVVLRGLARDPDMRFATALEMAACLEAAVVPSSQREVGEWVSRIGGETLRERARELRRIEAENAVTTTGEAPMDAAAFEVTETALLDPAVVASPPIEVPMAPHAPPMVASGPYPVPDVSGVYASRDARPRRVDARPFLVLAGVAGVLLAFGLGTLRNGSGPSKPWVGAATAATVAPPSVAAPSVAPSPVTPSPVVPAGVTMPAPSAAADLVSPAPSSAPVAVETVAPAVSSPPRSAAKGTARPPVVHRAPAPAKTTRASCNPPYTIDNGIKVPKRECL